MKNNRKIGFLLSLMMLIGTVVGIGIFFKNISVGKSVDYNGLSWLITWIIGGVISISVALCFSEIGSLPNKSFSGISNWMHKLKPGFTSYGISITYAVFYFGLLFTILGSFGSEIFFYFLSVMKIVDFNKIKIWIHLIAGAIISFYFLSLVLISQRASGIFQFVVTILKFIPLFAVMLIGIFLANTHNLANENQPVNAFINGSFTLKGVIIALPAVLFSYDAFLLVGSFGKKIKNSEKRLPIIVIVGMISITILYTLIALSSILHNAKTVEGILLDSLPRSLGKVIEKIIYTLLLISTFGVINGLTFAYKNEIESTISNELLFGSKYILTKMNIKKATLLYCSVIFLFYFIILLSLSSILNTDAFLDLFSNYPTVIFFGVYLYIIVLYSKNRKNINETNKINKIIFYSASIISFLGIITIELAYFSTIFSNLLNSEFKNNYGVFYKGSNILFPGWFELIIYFVFIIFALSIPVLNYYLEKIIFNRDLIDHIKKLR
ncbi:APC family permease [Mycoplasma sp. CSL7503-lung]|uniref:APC family permease n=1 Tax=Mycoplasma sp. CSL7503-lung TaxID=536372 RepID=UPI0021D2DDF0|nr:amino acid permease [Mycoplasma sp. CSL7503-lung]MCU4706889.1 amino acid permease [Mycoplasma sp. CSL7503-lung]